MLLTKRQFLTSVLALSVSAAARAAGGPSGPAVHFQSQGKIGEVFVNPYKIAPLTAVIGNGGYELRNASVRIVPKPNGQEIAYSVADRLCRTHGGIPVFGLYPDYQNTVEVEYDRVANDAARTVEHIRESYKIYAGPAYIGSDGHARSAVRAAWFRAEVLKRASMLIHGFFRSPLPRQFSSSSSTMPARRPRRLEQSRPAARCSGAALTPNVGIIDTTGAQSAGGSWMPDSIGDNENPIGIGTACRWGSSQTKDGALTWGYGQRYVKYDILGRRNLRTVCCPKATTTSRTRLEPMQNGHYLIRVSDADYRRADGQQCPHRSRRDHRGGSEQAQWLTNGASRTFWIRTATTVIKTLDQGAVCLNIDVDEGRSRRLLPKNSPNLTRLGQLRRHRRRRRRPQLGARQLRRLRPDRRLHHHLAPAISPRIIKIGRDKKVKWIIGSPEGWKSEASLTRCLQPVDKDGKPIKCEGSKCEGDFDWTWTQHTGLARRRKV